MNIFFPRDSKIIVKFLGMEMLLEVFKLVKIIFFIYSRLQE